MNSVSDALTYRYYALYSGASDRLCYDVFSWLHLLIVAKNACLIAYWFV